MNDSIDSAPRCWAVVPAAGIGSRMGATVPKQYLELDGETVLERTLTVIGTHPRIAGVVVAVAPHDGRFDDVAGRLAGFVCERVDGGGERVDSVLAALDALLARGAAEDWVLVHDAARPCLHPEDIDRLIDRVLAAPGPGDGAILGAAVPDTVKRVDDDQRITATVPRTGLYRALTPQMFRVGELHAAIRQGLAVGATLTDEASAMEHAGFQPAVVPGRVDNIKITEPQDLALARLFLRARTAEHEETPS